MKTKYYTLPFAGFKVDGRGDKSYIEVDGVRTTRTGQRERIVLRVEGLTYGHLVHYRHGLRDRLRLIRDVFAEGWRKIENEVGK